MKKALQLLFILGLLFGYGCTEDDSSLDVDVEDQDQTDDEDGGDDDDNNDNNDDDDEDDEDDDVIASLHFTEFMYQSNFLYSYATIDTVACTVTIAGVTDGDQITNFKYTLNDDDIVVDPEPVSLVGSLVQYNELTLSKGGDTVVYNLILSDFDTSTVIESQAIIYPEQYYGCEITKHFYDLKYVAGAINTTAKAEALFQEQDLNGVRISVYGDSAHDAHPSEGVVVASEYTSMISSINYARTARVANDGDTDFIVFASKKLNGQNSFPDWVKEDYGDGTYGPVNADKYSTLLIDFLVYMKSQGVTVHYLGPDNEWNYNEGGITAEIHYNIVTMLKEKLEAYPDIDMPLIVGPERFQPIGSGTGTNAFIYQLYKNNWESTMDVFGTHYYPQHHNSSMYSKLVYDFNATRPMPFWATEPHWDSANASNGYDEMMHAHNAFSAFWDGSDLGMDGFMWWSYSISGGSLRGNLMRAASVALRKSTPVMIIDHDGYDIMPTDLLDTRVFRKGNEMHLYIVNVTDEDTPELIDSYSNYVFGLDPDSGYVLDGTVSCTGWTSSSDVTGVNVGTYKLSDTQFSLNISKQMILYAVFKIKEA